MRAGIIVDNEFLNDVRVVREAGLLKAEGFDVHILCFGFGKSYQETEGFNITWVNISQRIKDILFFFMNLLPFYEKFWAEHIVKFIEKHQPDILHVHDLYMSKAAYEGIIGSGKKIPMILDLHENYPFQVTTYNWTKGFLRNMLSRPGEWKKKELEYLSYADAIIVLSDEYRESLLKEYPDLNPESIVAFPNVPDLNTIKTDGITPVENPFKNGYPLLLYYGVIAERRGIFEALYVFSELVKGGHKVNFLLIGPVDKKDRGIFEEIISLDYFRDRVVHIPWINSKDFPAWLAISDVCLAPFRKNPQHESGIANKIFEYMLGGKPLIVSDCLPQKNLVEKYNCGFSFSNEKEFSSAILTLLTDEMMRSAMGQNGQMAIKDHFNTRNFKDNLLSLYKTLNPNK